VNFNKFLKFVKTVKIRWAILGYVYIDSGIFQKLTTNNKMWCW